MEPIYTDSPLDSSGALQDWQATWMCQDIVRRCHLLRGLSCINAVQLSDTRWAQRLVVTGASGRRGAFEFTMAQR